MKEKAIKKYSEIKGVFTLYALLNDALLTLNKDNKSINDLWIDLYKDPNNESIIKEIIKMGLKDELVLTPQATVVVNELIEKDNKYVSLLFPYLVKPSIEVLPIVYSWFNSLTINNDLKQFAALLLSESKCIFALAVDSFKSLLKSENDQLRYRAQNVLQHPDRSPDFGEKRISIIGERTMVKILECKLTTQHIPRVNLFFRNLFL